MTVRVRVDRRRADAAEIDAAIAAIEHGPGFYFGTDGGIAGLHPFGATLLVEPSLCLRPGDRSVAIEPLDAFGAALVGSTPFDDFRRRASGGPPVAALRAFLAALPSLPEVRLIGAWRFDAHRLATGTHGSGDLGFFLFGRTLLERDASGGWHRVSLAFDDFDTRPSGSPPPIARRGHDGRKAVDDFAAGAYANVVARGIDALSNPGLVSLTLSQRFRRHAAGISATAAFERLRRANPAPATFCFHDGSGERVFGASPDLQVVVRGRCVESLPVCGTVARGDGAVGEAESLRALYASEVDAASLAVCSDALKNDLVPLCEPGTLQLTDRRRPMSLATVVHAVDRLAGTLRDGVDAWDALVATAAPPMLVGAPRREALAAIASLEASPRGWYGGLVVEVRGNGDARVGTLLRAASLQGGIAEVSTGGELLADSDPAHEAEESRVKAVSLWRALGLDGNRAGDASIVWPTSPSDLAPAGAGRERVAATLDIAVRLEADGDPFAASLVDALASIGVRVDPSARIRVVAGTGGDATSAEASAGCIVIGDAAFVVLQQSGFAVERTAPRHGRLARAAPTAGVAFIVDQPLVHVGVHARHRLHHNDVPAGWQVWLRETATGRPLALFSSVSAFACLLFRPESTLTDRAALPVLRHAIDSVLAATSSTAAARGMI